MYCIYILLLSNNLFYAGYSNDLKNRLEYHRYGLVRFTKSKRPVKLVYFKKCETKEKAIQRERQIKGWSRQKKINLIKHGHPTKF